jgi:hypothetical protein
MAAEIQVPRCPGRRVAAQARMTRSKARSALKRRAPFFMVRASERGTWSASGRSTRRGSGENQ